MPNFGSGIVSQAGVRGTKMASRITAEEIQAMRDVVGNGPSEMELIHSLHLGRNDIQMAINILFDSPSFKAKENALKDACGASERRSSITPDADHVKSSMNGSPSVESNSVKHFDTSDVSPNSNKENLVDIIQLDDNKPTSNDTNLNSISDCIPEATVCDIHADVASTLPVAIPLMNAKHGHEVIVIAEEDKSNGQQFSNNRRSPTDWNNEVDSDWWLLDATDVVGYSTCRGSKLKNGDRVTFNFPKQNQSEKSFFDRRNSWGRGKPSSEIVRFATASAGEIGRLPGDWARCLIPLVHSDKVKIEGKCRGAPSNLSLMDSIVLSIRLYVNQSFFKKYSSLQSTPSIEETVNHPLPMLMNLLGKTAFRKAEFTPEDLYTRKRFLDAGMSLNGQEGTEKRLKTGINNAVSNQGDNQEEELSDSDVDRVVGTSDCRELEEMEPPKDLECDLRPYQKQALFWMTKLEIGVTREDAAKTLHPCWAGYHLADLRASAFYINAFSGEATLDFPSALQTARGGILADAMGLGKTVMTISLLLANRGKGGSCPESSGGGNKSLHNSKKSMKGGGTLIVCPMTLIAQWKSELETHVKSSTFSVYTHYGSGRIKDSKPLLKHDVVLTTYGVVQSECVNSEDGPLHGVHWFRVVLDEAHTIKSSKNSSSQAIFKLVADRRWCLTGTPVQNKLEDIFSLLHFLRVEPWSNWGWWHKLIQKPYEEGDERGLKLLKAILKPLMLRRTKETTDKHGRPILVLPPTESHVIECELSEAERDFYNALYHRSKVKFDQFVEQGKVLHNYASILELLLRLRQCCDHPFLVLSRGDTDEFADLNKLARRFLNGERSGEDAPQGPSKAYVQEVVEDLRRGEKTECPICLEAAEDAVLTPCAHRMCRECLIASWRTSAGGACPICRQHLTKQDLITVPTNNRFRIDVESNWTESSKVAALLQELKALRAGGSKSIVFSQWTSFLDLLEIPFKRFKFGYVRLDGSLSQQQREKVIKEFSTNPNITIMLISLKAGGVGINLTAASNAFLLDPWWNPAVEEQAIMRIHRIGQLSKVSIKRFIVKGTVEEKMQQVQARKQRMIAGALTDQEVRTARIEELKMLFR